MRRKFQPDGKIKLSYPCREVFLRAAKELWHEAYQENGKWLRMKASEQFAGAFIWRRESV